MIRRQPPLRVGLTLLGSQTDPPRSPQLNPEDAYDVLPPELAEKKDYIIQGHLSPLVQEAIPLISTLVSVTAEPGMRSI